MGAVIRALLDAPRSVYLMALAWAVMLGAAGIVATKLDSWYYGLRFPGWKPPDWLFGPAWTTIFLCAAAAAIIGWTAPGATPELRRWIVVAWVLNGLLNVLWSLLFFRMQRPDWALMEVGLLWLSIVAMMFAIGRQSPAAVWLLVPYLVWVSFASALNRAIVVRNEPFGA